MNVRPNNHVWTPLGKSVANIAAVVSNPCAPDPRVERQAEWLREIGHTVTIHAFDREHQHSSTNHIKRHRVGITPYSSKIATLRGKRKFIRSLNLNADLLICHDADTLGVKFKGPRLFDMHDLAHTWITEGSNSIGKKIASLIAKRKMLRRAKSCQAVITSCEGFKLWLEKHSIASTVVENRPKRTKIMGTGGKIGYIGKVRHVDQFVILSEALDTMEKQPEVLIAGDGIALSKVKEILPNARFTGSFSVEDLPNLIQECGLMFAMYDPGRENISKGALPVKMFDAAAYGVPSIVTANTPMAEVCLNENLGRAVEWNDSTGLANSITELMGENVELLIDEKREKERFLDVINSILPK